MNKDKKEFWVDENLEPVLDKDFKESIDDHNSWMLTNSLKYVAFVEQNKPLTKEEIEMIRTFLLSMKSHKKILSLDKILMKNSEKDFKIKSLDTSDENSLIERVHDLYSSEYNIPFDYIKYHVDSDVQEYLEKKNRDNKLEKLLG